MRAMRSSERADTGRNRPSLRKVPFYPVAWLFCGCPPATAVVELKSVGKERERSGAVGENSLLAFRADRRNLRSIFTKFWKVEIGGRAIVPAQLSKALFQSMNPSEVRCMCNRCHPPRAGGCKHPGRASLNSADSPKFPIGRRAP
jgi:hypothetical protein